MPMLFLECVLAITRGIQGTDKIRNVAPRPWKALTPTLGLSMDGGRVQERGVANLNPWVDLLKQKATHASFRDYDSLPKSSAGISPSDGT
jgi:hypothetical protein